MPIREKIKSGLENVLNDIRKEFEMISKYLEIAEEFLMKKTEHLNRDEIEDKANELRVTLPESMIEFYEFFGNNNEVLKSFYQFKKLDEFEILHEGLIFGYGHYDEFMFGILLEQMSSEIPQILEYNYDRQKWFVKSLSYDIFFMNVACWQVFNTLPYIVTVIIKEEKLDSILDGKLSIISKEKLLYKGFDIYSYYNKEKNIVACYLVGTQELCMASCEYFYLESFKNELGLKLVWKLVKNGGDLIEDHVYEKSKDRKPSCNELKNKEIKMISKYLEIAEGFLLKKTEHLSRNIIENKANELGVTFPESMIEFYEFFGNNKKVLNSYFSFNNLDEFDIQNDGLIFGYAHQDEFMFGILLDQISHEIPQIHKYPYDRKRWYLESSSCLEFFLNVACWQVLNTMPNVAIADIEEKDLDNALEGKLSIICKEEPLLYKGYQVYSYYNKEKKILACYLKDIQELYVASNEFSCLESFDDESELGLDWV